MVCSAVGLFVSYNKLHFFGKIELLDIKSSFRFPLQLFSETFFILRKTERDMMIHGDVNVNTNIFKYKYEYNYKCKYK